MTERSEEFQAAAKYLAGSNLRLNNQQKLEFYAWYKQAHEGPCTTSKPGVFQFSQRAKWTAWVALKDMSKHDAMAAYIGAVHKLDPKWHESAGNDSGRGGEEKTSDGGGEKKHGGLSFGIGVSRPVLDESQDTPSAYAETEQANADDGTSTNTFGSESKNVWFCAVKGDVQGVKQCVEGLSSEDTADLLNRRNQSGLTPLILAVDRGHVDVVTFLLEKCDGAVDVNKTDADGTSPLATAVCNSNVAMVHMLCNVDNVDVRAVDSDGFDCLDAAGVEYSNPVGTEEEEICRILKKAGYKLEHIAKQI